MCFISNPQKDIIIPGLYPLQCDVHINALVPKIPQKLDILKYLMKYVTQSHLIYLYKAGVQPCIDYCITIWGYAADKYLNKFQHIMNRAARITSSMIYAG